MECDKYRVLFHQKLIVVIIWFIDIGRVGISFEVSELSRYLAFPRTLHLVQASHFFKCLEIHNTNDLTFGTCYQRFTSDQNIQSKVQATKVFYVDAGEEIPPNAPKPRGKPVQVNCFVNFYYAGDRSTQWYQTRIILYCSSVPIIWYSRMQNTM